MTRATARILALAGDLGGDGTVLAGALLASLAGLAVALAEPSGTGQDTYPAFERMAAEPARAYFQEV